MNSRQNESFGLALGRGTKEQCYSNQYPFFGNTLATLAASRANKTHEPENQASFWNICPAKAVKTQKQ